MSGIIPQAAGLCLDFLLLPLPEYSDCLLDTPCPFYSSEEHGDERLFEEEMIALREYLGPDGERVIGTTEQSFQGEEVEGNRQLWKKENVEGQIWKLTSEYLSNVEKLMKPSENQPQSEKMNENESAYKLPLCGITDTAFLALQNVTSHKPSTRKTRKHGKKPRKRSHLKAKRQFSIPITSVEGGKLRGKTGRKPQNYTCFKCGAVWPYKRNLIQHLREVHEICRSQSLLYKRLNQDPKEMDRLYGDSL